VQIVPRQSTPISAEHARDALLAAAPSLNRPTAALLLALIWIETGRGNLMNWNAGNITANDKWPGNAWRPPWFEASSDPHLAELHERMLAGTAPSAFRAYDSATHGFADFVATLNRQFPSVLAAASTGDPAAFVAALHDSGYSRDYRPVHIASFAALQHQLEPLVAHLPAGAGVAGLAVAGIALALLLRHTHKHKQRRRREWSYRTFRLT
jgi:hypothetical protein